MRADIVLLNNVMKIFKIAFLILLAVFSVVGCNIGATTDKTYDMVEWMIQTYPNHENTYLGTPDGSGESEFSYYSKDKRKIYRVDWPTNTYFEELEYDNNNIYIRKEVRDNSKGIYLEHTQNFIWTKRFVTVGSKKTDGVYTNSHYNYYENCVKISEGGTTFYMMVTGPVSFEAGGDVGTVDMLCIVQLNTKNKNYIEKYCYAKGWSMIHYEKIEDGKITLSGTFNTIHPAATPTFSICGKNLD